MEGRVGEGPAAAGARAHQEPGAFHAEVGGHVVRGVVQGGGGGGRGLGFVGEGHLARRLEELLLVLIALGEESGGVIDVGGEGVR